MKKMYIFLLSIALAAVAFCSGCSCSAGKNERTKYEIVAEYKPAENTLIGTVKVDFYNASEAELDSVYFQLYPNAYRKNPLYSPIAYDVMSEAYYAGESYGEITVSSVLGSANFEILGEDKNLLCVNLLKPIAPEERVVLDIGFSTRLAKINHRLGVSGGAINFAGAFPVACALENGNFYECVASDVGAPYYADCADYSMQLTLPKEYALACSGEIVGEKMLESKKRHTVSATNARDFFFAAHGGYISKQQKTGKTEVEYCFFSERNSAEILELAKRATEYFSSVFGEYPYGKLTLAQTRTVEGAADGSGIVFLSDGLTEGWGKDSAFETVKAIAAQWWYSGVGANRVETPWLVDGLCGYSAALFFGKYSGYGFDKTSAIEQAFARYQKYKETYRRALGWVDVRMNRPLVSYLNGYEYDSIACDRAMVAFAELEKGIGEKKMLSALRRYYGENRFLHTTPAHLSGAFERSGLNVGGFLESYAEGKGTF